MKLIVSLIISLFALQQVTAVPENTQRSLKDDLAAILQPIVNLIHETESRILGLIRLAVQDVEQAVSAAIQLVKDIIDRVLNAINALEQKALNLGVDVAECVVDEKELLVGMKQDTEDSLIDTSKIVINGLNKIESEVVDTIKGYVDVVQTLLDRFGKCGVLNILCMAKVIVDATTASLKLTLDIPAMGLRIANILKTTTADGLRSIAAITADVTVETEQMLGKVTKCVNDKLPKINYMY